ncbi:hypothetical protein [Candidatus Methylocalor cossyra]|uniref:SAVED domain-containing protein n=1 Tax=Candidatus Methylocalor cossyra TaxID=3108543 RepID=A0ABM9NKA6_9GAMM
MPQALLDFTNDVLDPIGIWIGLILAVPVFWTWIDLSLLRGRRHRRWLEQVRREPGRRPAILIVDLKPEADIRAQVENFRMTDPQLREIPEARIGRVFRDRALSVADLPALLDEVRDRGAEFMRQGVDTIHLFYAGPLAPMAMIGAQFANGFKVLVYQHRPGSGGGYENWGPLRPS